MLGKNVKIEGRTGIICFTSNYDGRKFINVCFDDNDEYKTYEIIINENKSDLVPVTDPNLLSSLSAIWVEEELERISENE